MKNNFFEKYSELKKTENYSEIITLGKVALESDKLTDLEKFNISLKLSSCYFYLGNYASSVELAKKVSSDVSFDDSNLFAKSLYLLSASNRAQAKQNELGGYRSCAHYYISEALKLSNSENISDFMRAKIYFNAGSLWHDIENNPTKALEYYKQAQNIFKNNDLWKDDYNRNQIRYIRCELELGNVNGAKILAEKLKSNIDKNSRTEVHFLQVRSKIAFVGGKFLESYDYVSQALSIAQNLRMVKDVERLEKLQDSILKEDVRVQKIWLESKNKILVNLKQRQ